MNRVVRNDNRIPEDKSRDSLGLLNMWVLLSMLVVGCGLFVLTLAGLSLSRFQKSKVAPATAILLIFPAASVTPDLSATQTANPPNLDQTVPAPPSGEIFIDAYVQVIGTAGEGLRLRDQPGLGGAVLLVASEAEVFKIEEGPIESDGYTWWRLEGPFDPNRSGWAVSNYLGLAQNP